MNRKKARNINCGDMIIFTGNKNFVYDLVLCKEVTYIAGKRYFRFQVFDSYEGRTKTYDFVMHEYESMEVISL